MSSESEPGSRRDLAKGEGSRLGGVGLLRLSEILRNCSRLVSLVLVSRRVQETEPMGGRREEQRRVADSRRGSEAAWPPKFRKFTFLGPGCREGLMGGKRSSWMLCCLRVCALPSKASRGLPMQMSWPSHQETPRISGLEYSITHAVPVEWDVH